MATPQETQIRLDEAAKNAEFATKAYKEVLTSEGEQDILLQDGTTTPNLNKRLSGIAKAVSSVNGKTGNVVVTREDLGLQSDELMARQLKEDRFVITGSGRTQREKNRESISVFDFMLKGEVMSSIVVQRALDSGYSPIYFPKYEYVWDDQAPIIKSNTTIFGEIGAKIIQNNFDHTATITSGTEYAGFKIKSGSENIEIRGFEIQGYFYDKEMIPTYRHIGIAIEGMYDYYYYQNTSYPNDSTSNPPAECKNIKILGNYIHGFGQSAIIADNVDNYSCRGNTFKNCGRDGNRMYGCTNFDVSENRVDRMLPGFPTEGDAPNFNVYGIAATRIYRSVGATGETGIFRPSQYGIISRNIVTNCPSWKALDTHGGMDITYENNVIKNAHIGIGIDKGGYLPRHGFAPPRRINIVGNIIIADKNNPLDNRAGIFAVAHEATDDNFGEDINISNNLITGFGQDIRDGAIVLSNYRRATLSNNIINNARRAGISFQQTVLDVVVQGGVISNIEKTSANFCAGISAESATQSILVDGLSFSQSGGDTLTALSSSQKAEGYGLQVGSNIRFQGNVVKFNGGGAYLDQLSPFILRTVAVGNVNTSATGASFSSARGLLSVNRTDVGRTVIKLASPLTQTASIYPNITGKQNSGVIFSTSVTAVDTINVFSRDFSGNFIDTGYYIEVKGY
jgi:hypothetical protein